MGEEKTNPDSTGEVVNREVERMETDDNPEACEPSTPSRLMITKMVLENFKSYAGVKEIGPFHKCFSSVVGPNGSGKSNVIDAMLFVFGKRAKKLRLNKVSELIHSSDAFKEKPLQYARVCVYFQEIIDTGDGDDDYEVIPNSEIVVSRIARRDNSSQYKLDGKISTFKQVATFLNSKGIDLDNNRFLILQGEVEMISMMAPKGKTENDDGLLEYLEDIIGSNKYVEQTNEAELKVEALGEQRQERLNRVKAVEKEKESLQGAKLEAESLLGKEREIRRKKNILYQINKMEVEREFIQIEEKNKILEKQVEEERTKWKETDTRVSEIENGLMEQTSEYDKAYDELVKTKEKFAEFERRDIKLKEEIKHEKANKKKLSAKIKSNTKKEEEAIKKAEMAEEKIPVLEKKINKLSRIKDEEDLKLEKIFEQTKDETQSLRMQLEEKNQELSPVSQERTVYQAALSTAITEVKLLEDSTTRAKKQLDAAETELASLDDAQSNMRSNLVKLEDELTESRNRIEEAAKEDVELAEKEKSLASQHSELVAKAEETKALMQSSNSRSKAVSSILKAARKGSELSKVGIVGRLGDLATIDQKYDVAISTACGMLDHIVVQTTAGAQCCLDFLRKYDLGRANFIPLDKMKKGAHDRAVETPENAPRLFDLIRPSNYAVIPALYLGVGNTLVAPDLDVASRWAFDFGKRWRVVTADGNLIESSGTMQGGGKSVRRGGMRISNSKGSVSVATSIGNVSEDDFSEFESKAAKTLEQLKECRARRKSLNDEVRKLKKRIQQLEVQLPKISMEIAGCDTTREELTKSIPELKKQSSLSKSDQVKLSELNKKVKTCETDMAACAKLASKLEKEVSILQKSILEAGGEELKIQQKRCDTVIAKLNIRTKELSSAKVDVTSSRKAAAKAKSVIESAEQESEEIRKRLDAKMEELKSLEEKAMKVMEDFEEVKKVEQVKKKELEAVSKEYEELKKIQSKLKHSEVETIGKMDAYKRSIQDLKKRANHWVKEISKLNLAQEQDEDYDYSDDEEEEDDDGDISDEEGNKEFSNTQVDDKQTENTMLENMDAEVAGSEKEKQNNSKKRKISKLSESKNGLPVYPEGALEQYSRHELNTDLATLEKERDSIAKNANMGAIDEYRKKETDYLARVAELDEITETRNIARKEFEELRRLRLEKFMDGFGIITLKLKEMYQMITLGGDAELELVDSLDPFSEGIVFSVRPPKKSWKNIANLSGGEKTLSSLALVFALHHYKPTPLYVMDEIDAALDFKNVSIVANYIKDRTKNAQFIIISLRNNMFELADRLVGIYKTHNCTKSVTINPKAYSNVGKKRVTAPTPLKDRTNQSMST